MQTCQCGCGQPTKLAPFSSNRLGWVKGQPIKFINGHNNAYCFNPNWKSGHVNNGMGYMMTKIYGHPRANNGYVFDHILLAEKALGKYLPQNASTHHFPNLSDWTHLVICENESYHHLLHERYKAFITCGNPNLRRCWHCKKWDNPNDPDMYKQKNGSWFHRSCRTLYQINYRKNKKVTSRTSPNMEPTEELI